MGATTHGRWALEGQRLTFTHPAWTSFWDMPQGYRMPSPALLNLAEFLLLVGLKETIPQEGSRPPGRRTAVAYSGGVDSTASLRLLPGALPIYTRMTDRAEQFREDNALLALAEVDGIAISTNSDRLATSMGKKVRGFYGTGCFTTPSVLLADHFDLGVVADGNVMETVYMLSNDGHGTRYSTPDRTAILERFRAAGLEYCAPCAGLTEVATTALATGVKYAMGCIRGTGGLPCGRCIKCYRKDALRGTPIATPPIAENTLRKPIIPMLPSLLWANRHRGLRHPILDRIDKEIDWADGWYEDALRFVPAHLHETFRARLAELGVRTVDDVEPIVTWVSDHGSAGPPPPR